MNFRDSLNLYTDLGHGSYEANFDALMGVCGFRPAATALMSLEISTRTLGNTRWLWTWANSGSSVSRSKDLR
jgi:hypothetical protein